MMNLFRRRSARTRACIKRTSSFIEPLESRTLLSADVNVALQMTTPTSVLLPGEQPRDLVYDASRHQLLAVLHDRIRRYDGNTGSVLGSIKLGSDLHAADITPDGKYLYVTDLHNPAVYKIDLDTSTYTSIQVPLDSAQARPGDIAICTSALSQNAIVGEYPESPSTLFRSREIDLANDGVGDVLL